MSFIQLLHAIWEGNLWAIAVGVEFMALALAVPVLTAEQSRAWVLNWLRSRRGTRLYERLLTPPLNWLDHALTPEDVEDRPKPFPGMRRWWNIWWLMAPRAPSRGQARWEGRAAFGWPVFGMVLKLALAFPILFLVFSWATFGGAGRIGEFVVLAPTEVWPTRALTAAGLTLVLGLALASRDAQASRRQHFAAAAGGFALAIAFAVVVSFTVVASGAFVVAVSFAVAGAVAFKFAVALAGAVAGAIQVAGAYAGAISVAGVSVFAILASLSALLRREWRGWLAYSLFAAFGFIALAGAVALTPEGQDHLRTWTVFLGVLPLVDACFDYLSFGVTRWLIRRGVAVRNVWTVAFGLADFAVALVLFTLLGLDLVAVLTLMNAVSATPVIDIRATLIDIDGNPGDYWWLYATMFSTLLPTFAHAVLSTLCLVRLIPFRGITARLIENTANGFATALGGFFLSLIWSAAVVAPLAAAILLGWAIASSASLVGGHYLYLFFQFAEWLDPTLEIPRGGTAI